MFCVLCVCVCVLKKDIDSVLQILQVPFDTTQRVTQLRCGPLNLSASVLAKLTPTQIESSCFVQRFEDLTATIEARGQGHGVWVRVASECKGIKCILLDYKKWILQRHDPRSVTYLLALKWNFTVFRNGNDERT